MGCGPRRVLRALAASVLVAACTACALDRVGLVGGEGQSDAGLDASMTDAAHPPDARVDAMIDAARPDASRDGGRDASLPDASPHDAGPDDAGAPDAGGDADLPYQPCDVLFGTLPGYRLCVEGARRCEFHVSAGAACDARCGTRSATCLGSFTSGSGPAGECTRVAGLRCDNPGAQICVCSRVR